MTSIVLLLSVSMFSQSFSLSSFVDPNKDPWSYVDRYNNEASYKEWFDNNYPEITIYQAVGLKTPLSFVDSTKDPWSYVDRYNNEASYKEWFDENYSDYDSIYEAVGKRQPVPDWIKNNAIWWSEGKLSEDEFVGGIEYLVKNKIINVD